MKKIKIKNNEELETNVVEAFDTLRVNISNADKDARTIVMTSAGTKEGKSLIAFQLAVNMATNGKRTLLVMADYRKSISGNDNGVKGMSETVRGMASLNDTVFKTDIPNMYLMFSGGQEVSPEKIVQSKSFDKMLQVIRNKFDYILFDTAPVLEGAVTSLICEKCDGTVLIVEQEKSTYESVFRAKEQIELSKSKILGVVLNNPE